MEQETALTPEELISRGYAVVSRAHRLVARVDRPDWIRRMAAAHAPWDPNEGFDWLALLGNSSPDHYRRTYSNDHLIVPANYLPKLPNSTHTSIGYVPTPEDNVMDLKIYPVFFAKHLDGSKHYELRSTNDRTFHVGQILRLREYDPIIPGYTGRSLLVYVTYVLAEYPGIAPGYALLSTERIGGGERVAFLRSE